MSAADEAQDSADEEGGEGYFASISDLMVGILFVFLLMLTVLALSFRDAEDQQDIKRAEYERQLELTAAAERRAARYNTLLQEVMAQLERDIEDRAAARERLLVRIEQSLSERGVNVVVDKDSGVLRLSGDLLFPTGESTLQPGARRTVLLLAEAMQAILPCFTAQAQGCGGQTEAILETVLVEGHTDRQQYGRNPALSETLNDRLSTERALTVFTELRRAQPGLDQLRNGVGLPVLGVSGYGERRPLPQAQGNTPADFAQNRRIDLRFVLSARSSQELERLRARVQEALQPVPPAADMPAAVLPVGAAP